MLWSRRSAKGKVFVVIAALFLAFGVIGALGDNSSDKSNDAPPTTSVTTTAAASAPRGIEFLRDPLSFCIELHSGRYEFQIRLRNKRGVATRLTVSVENGPRRGFVLPATTRVSVLRGLWNGKHRATGCRTTVAWGHARLVVDLPLAQE